MASRISTKVEEEVRALVEHCWELGSKQKHVQKSKKLPDLFKYVFLRKLPSLLNDFATFISFFISRRTTKSIRWVFPPWGHQDFPIWTQCTICQIQLYSAAIESKHFWSWLFFFFTVIYNHRKQVLMKFIFKITSSLVSCFQVRTSWISSTYSIQSDLQAPSPCQSRQKCQFKAWFPTSRFQKWNSFISWRMKPFLWVEKSGLVFI